MKRTMIITVLSLLLVAVVWIGALFFRALGRSPRGARLERCRQSPHWKEDRFVNHYDTPQLTGDDGFFRQMWNYLFNNPADLKPGRDLPTDKHNLCDLPPEAEVCVWLGHSSLFVQTGGVRYLFDPVLTCRMPVTLFMRPFKGSAVYTPDDMPDIDYLIITHDHWDHLDYATVRELRPRVKHVVCALGIGEHFQYWGYDPQVVHDVDWFDTVAVDASTTLRCLPSRHFSGRLGGKPRTLWASYLIDGPRRIFVSGDGGYDDRFARIGTDYPGIDLAVMENGQYDKGWCHIHTMPSELPKAISELGARRVLTYHNAKFALAKHPWYEPLDCILDASRGQEWQLLTPMIGQPVLLDADQQFSPWWRG